MTDEAVQNTGVSSMPGQALSQRYDAIADECMELARVWRSRIIASGIDKAFHADQHRRALLRAASFSRLAQRSRDREKWCAQGIETGTAAPDLGRDFWLSAAMTEARTAATDVGASAPASPVRQDAPKEPQP